MTQYYFYNCPYPKCKMGCKNKSSHHAFYASLNTRIQIKKSKSLKINYDALKK